MRSVRELAGAFFIIPGLALFALGTRILLGKKGARMVLKRVNKAILELKSDLENQVNLGKNIWK